jgi:hypothetical protein
MLQTDRRRENMVQKNEIRGAEVLYNRDLVKRTYKAAVKPLKKEPKGFEAWIKQKKKGY